MIVIVQASDRYIICWLILFSSLPLGKFGNSSNKKNLQNKNGVIHYLDSGQHEEELVGYKESYWGETGESLHLHPMVLGGTWVWQREQKTRFQGEYVFGGTKLLPLKLNSVLQALGITRNSGQPPILVGQRYQLVRPSTSQLGKDVELQERDNGPIISVTLIYLSSYT